MLLGIVLGLLLVLAAIRAATVEPRTTKPFLRDAHPVILAHQGASGHAPSNTLEAFELAMKQGADILEVDVHLTSDGVVVVSHDDTIDRLTNGKGRIREMSLTQLRTYDFGHGFTPDEGKTFPYRGKGIAIPTLEEVFQRFPGVRVNIEIKQTDPPVEEKLWDLIRRYHMEDKVLINSFHADPIERWRHLTGERTTLGATRRDMYRFAAYWLPRLDWMYHPTVDAFQLPTRFKLGPVVIDLATSRLLSRAHKLGIKVHYWTINDETTMRGLLETGADGIITDYPDRAVKVMREMGLRK